MSNFKVGDICVYKPVKGEPLNKNIGKIFTLCKFVGQRVGFNYGNPMWEADTLFCYNDGVDRSWIDEQHMRKLDNPDDDAVDEMVALVGKAPKVKEVEHAL
jgi:hypothetical protein